MNLINTTGWTLLHFLWQGTAIALLLVIANAFLKRRSANARYLVACAAMLLMAACIAITFLLLLPNHARTALPAAMLHFTRPVLSYGRTVFPASTPRASSNWLPIFVYMWLAGVCCLALRAFGGWLMVQRFRRRAVQPVADIWQQRLAILAERLQIRQRIRLCESALAEVPSVIGWLRPLVLLPASALTGLTPRQLEALLAHELAHIRRNDYLINLIQTTIETLLFYHPAVWWVGHRMRAEREHCCDDLAVSVCGDVLGYARALARMEELRGGAPALAMAADGGSLLGRIRRLLRNGEMEGAGAADWLTAAGVTLCALAVWAAPHIPVRNPIPPPIFRRATFVRSAVHANMLHRLGVALQRVEVRHAHRPTVLPVAFVAQAEPSAPLAPPPPPAPPEPATESTGHGFLAGLEGAGYRNLSVDELIQLKENGVTGEFIRQLQAAGYHPTIHELIALREYGVTAEYIGDLRSNGLNNLTIPQIIKLKMYGARPSTLAAMRAAGYHLTAEQMVSLQMNGVTPELAQRMKQLGYGDPSPEDLVRLQTHGVTPDYATAMKEAGLHDLNIERLVRLKDHGSEPGEVRELGQLGFANLTVEDVIRLRDFGVTPDYIRRARQHGFNNLTLQQLIKLKQFGILD